MFFIKFSITFNTLLNVFVLINESSASPILSLELMISQSKATGLKTVIHYIDSAKSLGEKVTLSCFMGGADEYEWTLFGKIGSPYYGSLIVDPKEADESKPWEKEVCIIIYGLFFTLLCKTALKNRRG